MVLGLSPAAKSYLQGMCKDYANNVCNARDIVDVWYLVSLVQGVLAGGKSSSVGATFLWFQLPSVSH